MGFGKGFGIGLILFIVINLVMAILALVLNNQIGQIASLFTDMSLIGETLFGSILMTPPGAFFDLISIFFSGSIDLGALLPLIGFIAAPLVAALVAGKLCESKGQAFGAWFLICIISVVVLWVFAFISGDMSSLSSDLTDLLGISISGEIFVLIYLIIIAAINGIFYGCFAVLMSGESFI